MLKKSSMRFCYISIFVALVVLFLIIYNQEETLDTLLPEIYELPMTVTASELEEKGFINLTKPQQKPVDAVVMFFSKENAPRKKLLKTFTETEKGLVLRIFEHNDSNKLVSMYTYYVVEQFAENNGVTFKRYCDNVKNTDGTIEVWLRAAVADGSYPQYPDHLLYRYLG